MIELLMVLLFIAYGPRTLSVTHLIFSLDQTTKGQVNGRITLGMLMIQACKGLSYQV